MESLDTLFEVIVQPYAQAALQRPEVLFTILVVFLILQFVLIIRADNLLTQLHERIVLKSHTRAQRKAERRQKRSKHSS